MCHPIAQIPKTVRDATLDGLKGALRMKNNKVKNRQINPNSSSNPRRREKAYRCPVNNYRFALFYYFGLTFSSYLLTDATMY
jgi:hypothetical protein